MRVLSVAVFVLAVSIVWSAHMLRSSRTARNVIKHQRKVPPVRIRSPINIRTRGISHYVQIGLLHGGDDILPLFGRRTYNGSHMWNYYTVSNDHNPIHIPIEVSSRDCQDAYGCKELYDGDSIHVIGHTGAFNVKLYDRSPRYIP